MNTYNVTITPEDTNEDTEMFQVTAEDVTTLKNNIEDTANYNQEVSLSLEDGTYLHIDQNSEHGFNADLYENKTAYDNWEDPIGGGLCTGTLADAIEMATTNR
jgi:hypothetical protein